MPPKGKKKAKERKGRGRKLPATTAEHESDVDDRDDEAEAAQQAVLQLPASPLLFTTTLLRHCRLLPIHYCCLRLPRMRMQPPYSRSPS
jgi:hypothetical protein